jgi:hypothetical protein
MRVDEEPKASATPELDGTQKADWTVDDLTTLALSTINSEAWTEAFDGMPIQDKVSILTGICQQLQKIESRLPQS